jgi:hypothetical protein
MKKVYEAWDDEPDGGITLAEVNIIQTNLANGLLSKDARLLHRIEADTFEEAQAVHNIKMGWSPFVPEGKPKACPQNCGAVFYPEGSGECPNCGRIC